MIRIDGNEYISDKEAEHKYGFTQEWFKKQRSLKKGPPFVKTGGRVFYSIEKLDQYFIDKFKN